MSSTPTPKRRRLNSMVPTAEYSEPSLRPFTWLNPLTTDGLHSTTINSERLGGRRYLDRSPPTTFRLEDSLNRLSFKDNLDDSIETDADVLTLTRE